MNPERLDAHRLDLLRADWEAEAVWEDAITEGYDPSAVKKCGTCGGDVHEPSWLHPMPGYWGLVEQAGNRGYER